MVKYAFLRGDIGGREEVVTVFLGQRLGPPNRNPCWRVCLLAVEGVKQGWYSIQPDEGTTNMHVRSLVGK